MGWSGSPCMCRAWTMCSRSTSTAATTRRKSPMATCSCRQSRNTRGTISNSPTPPCCSDRKGVDNVFALNFNGRDDEKKVTYGDVFLQAEQEYSRHNFQFADTAMLFEQFKMAEAACKKYIAEGRSEEHTS